jgi:hypothetical protein
MSNHRKVRKITSDFAVLDVKGGRSALFKELGYTRREGGPAPIPVTITGEIVGAWGHDDGISREFQIRVTGVVMR